MAVVARTHRAGRSRVALGGCRLYKASCVPAASSRYAVRAMILVDLVRRWGVGNREACRLSLVPLHVREA